MTPLSSEDARLETWLRRDLDAPLPDNGFSARVLDALPRQQGRALRWGRIAAPIAGALAGLAFALWQGAHWSDLMSVVTQLDQATLSVSNQLTDTGWIVILPIALAFFAIEFLSDDPIEEKL